MARLVRLRPFSSEIGFSVREVRIEGRRILVRLRVRGATDPFQPPHPRDLAPLRV